MLLFLSSLPILSTIIALSIGMRSLYASFFGVGAALFAIILAFPISTETVISVQWHWLPVIIEVLLIVGGGLLLSEVLRHAGGQRVLANWIARKAGQKVDAVLLVVHGVTPFAESVTGFGIGVTIGIPLLIYFGLSGRRAVIIGLLGLCAVPWGSMGPGTLIAARMSGLSFHDLGVASAVVSIIPLTITGIIAAWLVSPSKVRGRAILLGMMSGLIFTLLIIVINIVFGTPPAGALGALIMIAIHLLRGRKKQDAAAMGYLGRKVLTSYAVLLGGVLITGWLVRTVGLTESWRYLGSPALWLFIAVLWFTRGIPDFQPMRRAWISWLQVAPVTAMFILLGILMAVSAMAAFLAQKLSEAGSTYLVISPFIGAIGGFITGSNSGANAMFATTQAEIAHFLGIDILWLMAVHNVAAAFLPMASPGKIEMAMQLVSPEMIKYRYSLQITMLWISFAVISMLAIFNFTFNTFFKINGS